MGQPFFQSQATTTLLFSLAFLGRSRKLGFCKKGQVRSRADGRYTLHLLNKDNCTPFSAQGGPHAQRNGYTDIDLVFLLVKVLRVTIRRAQPSQRPSKEICFSNGLLEACAGVCGVSKQQQHVHVLQMHHEGHYEDGNQTTGCPLVRSR